MNRRTRLVTAIAVLFAVDAFLATRSDIETLRSTSGAPSTIGFAAAPKIMLWAWERWTFCTWPLPYFCWRKSS